MRIVRNLTPPKPYGRILDITPPTPQPAGSLRFATVTFRYARSAAIARNTVHGLAVPSDPSSTNITRLRTMYQQPIQAHVIRDYISSHPRIFLPIFIFLIGSLTYTVRFTSLYALLAVICSMLAGLRSNPSFHG